MATTISLHGIAKTEISAVRKYSANGNAFWSQSIIVHFPDGQRQSIDLYSNESPDALVTELQAIENSVAP